MRSILIDWLVDVHLKFKLFPETLYLTVNLIDRYLEIEQVNRQYLQLIGVTAMLIASKYEEIYAPEIRDFVYVTDKAYTRDDILRKEYHILTTLDFDVTFTSSFRFLERYCKLNKSDEFTFNLSRYLIELALVDYKMLKYSPSMLAAGALFLSNKIFKKEVAWPNALEISSGLKDQDIRPCAKSLCVLLQYADKSSSSNALRKKFAHQKFKEVSKIKIDTHN
jgi:hypothetical protein